MKNIILSIYNYRWRIIISTIILLDIYICVSFFAVQPNEQLDSIKWVVGIWGLLKLICITLYIPFALIVIYIFYSCLKKRKYRLQIISIILVLLSIAFPIWWMHFEVSWFDNLATLDRFDMAKTEIEHSPDNKYTVYTIFDTDTRSETYILTEYNSDNVLSVDSALTIMDIESAYGGRSGWNENDGSIDSYYRNHYYSDYFWIELPPTLWDRLRTWIILQKYPELSNPEFLNSARESVEE